MATQQEIDQTYEWITRAQAGDAEAMDALLRAYECWIWRVVAESRIYSPVAWADRDDLYQTAAQGFTEAVMGWDPARASDSSQSVTPFLGYAQLAIRRELICELKRLARRNRLHTVYYEERRRENEKGESSTDPLEWYVPGSHDPEVSDQPDYGAFAARVRELLTETEWRVLRAMYLSGRPRTYGDVARELGMSRKAVDNAIQRVRQKLKPIRAELADLLGVA